MKLVLGSPPSQRDPFTQPATSGDPQSWFPAPWTRTPDGQQWEREVITAVYERGQRDTRIDVAGPERAAELDQAAAQVVLQNAANSRPAIAARYEAAYVQNGWAAYGSIPEAVQHARTDLDVVTASDDNRYQRHSDGRWINDGVIYNSTASGNLRAELDATRDVVAATLPPPPSIHAPPLMTADERMRDTLRGAYANAGLKPSEEHLTASATAVKATQAAHDLNPDTTALKMQRNPDGGYDLTSAVANLRLAPDGKSYTIAAITTAEDIQRAQGRAPFAVNQVWEHPAGSSVDLPVKTTRMEGATTSREDATSSPLWVAMHQDPLYRQIREGVAELDSRHGREFDAASERMTASLLVLAKSNRLTQVDHVVLSHATSEHPTSHNVFVVQGKLDDPAHLRAAMPTEQALAAPIEESIVKYEVISRHMEQQTQAVQLQEQQEVQTRAAGMMR